MILNPEYLTPIPIGGECNDVNCPRKIMIAAANKQSDFIIFQMNVALPNAATRPAFLQFDFAHRILFNHNIPLVR